MKSKYETLFLLAIYFCGKEKLDFEMNHCLETRYSFEFSHDHSGTPNKNMPLQPNEKTLCCRWSVPKLSFSRRCPSSLDGLPEEQGAEGGAMACSDQ